MFAFSVVEKSKFKELLNKLRFSYFLKGLFFHSKWVYSGFNKKTLVNLVIKSVESYIYRIIERFKTRFDIVMRQVNVTNFD